MIVERVRTFEPTGMPGARVPHAWLVPRAANESLLDRIPLYRFALLVGPGALIRMTEGLWGQVAVLGAALSYALAAVYGRRLKDHPPLVNASRPPGQWRSYDIVFRRPHFDTDGALVRPARVTVLHNGVLVHDNVVLTGPTGHKSRPPYKAHDDTLPLMLQDHSEPVRYRNIWVRELPENDQGL